MFADDWKVVNWCVKNAGAATAPFRARLAHTFILAP
jgi:hypothetical protein